MSDIKLVSEKYTSRFVTGPELQTELSKKQDNVGLYIGDNGSIATDNGGISQFGGMYENFFDGFTRFGTDVEIQGTKPVLDVTSSDDSVTVTRSADGYTFDLKANGGSGGSKYISDDAVHGNLVLGRGTDGSTPNSIFVEGPIYMSYPMGDNGYGSISADRYPMGLYVEIKAESTFSGTSASIEVAAESGAFITLKINDRELTFSEDDLRKLREILDAHS